MVSHILLKLPNHYRLSFQFKAGLQNEWCHGIIDQQQTGWHGKGTRSIQKRINRSFACWFRQPERGSAIDRLSGFSFLHASKSHKCKTRNAGWQCATSAAPKTGAIDQTITIKVIKDVMKYDKQLITVKAGTTVQIIIQNPDFMQHNLVLIKPTH